MISRLFASVARKKVGGATPFPDFDKILDFTSAGSESSVSVAVDGDTDKEYKVIIEYYGTAGGTIRLNNDSTANKYGHQGIDNNSASASPYIEAARYTVNYLKYLGAKQLSLLTILTPTGFIKTCFCDSALYSTGTTVTQMGFEGVSFNSTSNVTSIDVATPSGNFTSGTRVIVYKRRVNT